MSMFRNLLIKAATAVKGPDTFICKIKNTNSSAVTPYIAFPVRSAYSGIPSITVTIETSTGQSQTLTITGTNLTTKNDTSTFALGRIDYFSAVSMAQNETATVTIYSKTCKFPSFSFFSTTEGRDWGKKNALIYEVNTPLPVFIDGYCGSIFYNSLLTSLSEDLFQYGGSIKELRHTFACSSLTTVPENLFSGMTKVTSLESVFVSCRSLTTVPENLFSGLTNVTSLESVFDYTGLTSIPENLFSGLTNVTNLRQAFCGCRGLTSIPAGLFDGMTNVTNVSYLFQDCTSLTTVPSGLFDGMTKVTNVSYLFAGCTGLTSLPANLFRNQTKATNFSYCFYKVLASVIHANIFCNESTEKTTRFADVTPNFSNCFASLTGTEAGTAPALWNYTYKSTPTSTKCFNGSSATTLTNYSSIPSGWL